MVSRTRRTLFSAAIFLTTCGLAGTFVARKVGAQSNADESTLRNDLKSFTNVYEIVEANCASSTRIPTFTIQRLSPR